MHLNQKLSNKLILPGIEITCYGKHLLAIFPELITKGKIDSFLLECGISHDEHGSDEASADRVTPLTLCETVEKYGGIVIIAHCDTEKGLLESYFKKTDENLRGISITKILRSYAVHGICLNLLSNLKRLEELLTDWDLENLAIIQASDCHSSLTEYKGPGLPIGTRASWVKVSNLSFNSLKMALKTPVSRISLNPPSTKINPIILGMAINGGFIRDLHKENKWAIIPFADELNCLIGARGTGKSTIIDILEFLLNPKDIRENIHERFDSAVVFLQQEDKLYAICLHPKSATILKPKYFLYDKNKFISVHKNKLKQPTHTYKHFAAPQIQGYRQKELYNLGQNDYGPTEVVDSLCSLLFPEDFNTTNLNYRKNYEEIISHCHQLITDRLEDENADLTSDYLEKKYNNFSLEHNKLSIYRKDTVTKINSVLKNRLMLEYSFLIPKKTAEDVVGDWLYKLRRKQNTSYSEIVEYKKILLNLFETVDNKWAIPFLIFTNNHIELEKNTGIPSCIAKQLCQNLYDKVSADDVAIKPQVVVDFHLNVKHGVSNKPHFVHRSKLSFGQKAVGMLLLILHGATGLGESLPLIIDQPEDDLDNSYIYHTLVTEFQNIKQSRQLIIATHNPNIPVAGDSDNILALSSDGHNGWIERSGAIEDIYISESVLQILEGGFDAFNLRAEKYGFIFDNSR